MPRSAAALSDELNQAAVEWIEQGLGEGKTMKEILASMRREPRFAGLSASRVLRQWNTMWRPQVAANGRVPLPRKGGDRRRGPRRENRRTAPQAAAPRSGTGLKEYRAALEEMMDAVSAMLSTPADGPARDRALRIFPRFVQAVRAVARDL